MVWVFLHGGALCWLDGLRAGLAFPVLQQQQNLGRGFGASKMHLSPPVAWAAFRFKAVVLLLTFCLLSLWLFCVLLYVTLCPF